MSLLNPIQVHVESEIFHRRPVVKRRYGNISDSTLYRWIENGTFPRPMSAVLRSDGVQGDTCLVDNGVPLDGRTMIPRQEIKDRLREIETAIVSMDASLEEKADVCELVEGFLDRLDEDV